MQTITTKPTKAMTDWLLWISKGGVIERTSVSDPVAIRSTKRIGWEMLDKLETAGFIVWSAPYNASQKYKIIKYKVLLTDAGMAAVSGKH